MGWNVFMVAVAVGSTYLAIRDFLRSRKPGAMDKGIMGWPLSAIIAGGIWINTILQIT